MILVEEKVAPKRKRRCNKDVTNKAVQIKVEKPASKIKADKSAYIALLYQFGPQGRIQDYGKGGHKAIEYARYNARDPHVIQYCVRIRLDKERGSRPS